MCEDEKAAGKPCQEPHAPADDAKGARKRAPDQDVLPGILGKQLRAAYGELLNAPIPDAFSDLIKRLEGQPGESQPGTKSGKPRQESDQ